MDFLGTQDENYRCPYNTSGYTIDEIVYYEEYCSKSRYTEETIPNATLWEAIDSV